MWKHPQKSIAEIIEFFEQWKTLASILAGIAYAISSVFAFASETLWLSVVVVLVGVGLISLLLVKIIRLRDEETRIVLPSNAKYDQYHGRYIYPRWARVLAFIGLSLLFVTTVSWIWFGFIPQVRKNSLSENAIQLPYGESIALKVSIDPRPIPWELPVILIDDKNVDHTVITQTINNPYIASTGQILAHVSSQLTRTNNPLLLRVIITGKSRDEPAQIFTSVPIKVLDHQPITEVVNLATVPAGGGMYDFWLLGVEISERTVLNPNQIVWATYTPDLREQLTPDRKMALFDPIPSEVSRAIDDGIKPLPDSFLLEENDREVLSVAAFFQSPGIYRIQMGVEYFYQGKRDIIWTSPSVKVYVIKDYYLWSPVNPHNAYDRYRVVEKCTLNSVDGSSDYQCNQIP